MYKKMDWLFKQTVLTSEVGACCSAVCRIQLCTWIKIINDKARHNLMDVKCKWRSNRLDSAVSFKELLGQTKVMQICQRKTPNHHEICCLHILSTEHQSAICERLRDFHQSVPFGVSLLQVCCKSF